MAYLCDRCKKVADCDCRGPMMGYRICSVCGSADQGWFCSCHSKSVRVKRGYTLREVLSVKQPVKLCEACKTKYSRMIAGEKILHRCDDCWETGIVMKCSANKVLVK